MAVLKKFGVLSLAKLKGVLMAVFGLIAGIIYGLIGIIAGVVSGSIGIAGLGIAAIIFLPIIYGFFGFVMGALMAFLYNLVAGWIGGIEMEFEVLKSGMILVPNYHFFNEEGICIFVANDHDPDWWRKPRPVGHFISTAWIPGNFLSEGTLIVGAAISTMDPVIIHFYESDTIAFQVVDSVDGDSARGDYTGFIPGVVRPLLRWTTRFSPAGAKL